MLGLLIFVEKNSDLDVNVEALISKMTWSCWWWGSRSLAAVRYWLVGKMGRTFADGNFILKIARWYIFGRIRFSIVREPYSTEASPVAYLVSPLFLLLAHCIWTLPIHISVPMRAGTWGILRTRGTSAYMFMDLWKWNHRLMTWLRKHRKYRPDLPGHQI